MKATEPTQTRDQGATLDVLVNYYLTKIRFADKGETVAVPEFNMKPEGAAEAFYAYVCSRGRTEVDGSVAFELAMHLANIVSRKPFDAEAEIRDALERAFDDLEHMDRVDREFEKLREAQV